MSDDYETLYPYAPYSYNEGGTLIFTKDEIDQMNVVTVVVSIISNKQK